MAEDEEAPAAPERKGFPFVTIAVCLWAGLVFLALGSLDSVAWEETAKWGYYPPDAVYSGAGWGHITSAFVHVNLIHLLFNLYWMWQFGSFFEKMHGPMATVAFVIVTAFVSSGAESLAGSWGVGLSGVIYAFFGFGWAARYSFMKWWEVVDDGIVRFFLGWGVFAVILTYTGVYEIGNYAHFGGMLMGLVIGASVAQAKWKPVLAVAGLALMAMSVLSLFWSPLSPYWVSVKANEAMEAERFDESAALLKRSLALGQDPAWVFESLAMVYGYQQKTAEYAEALANLREVSPEAADRIEQAYGSPAQ